MARKKNKKGTKVDYNATKKYLYIGGLILILFFLCSGIYTLYNYETYGKYENSYLITNKEIPMNHILNINSASETLKSLNGDYYIYISYTNSKEVYNLEKNLKKLITSYNLKDKFYYLNVNNIYNDPNFKDEINAYLGYRDAKVSSVPTIVYVNKDNVVRIENIITREDNNMMTLGDFQKLLDINEISK